MASLQWSTVWTAFTLLPYLSPERSLSFPPGCQRSVPVGSGVDGLVEAADGTEPTGILVVAQTLTKALATNLTQVAPDLVGDGWKVVRHDAPRHDDATWANNTNNIAVIKGWITNDYNADPTNTKAIYILGHVAIPYSGWLNPDSHFLRPWPSGFRKPENGIETWPTM